MFYVYDWYWIVNDTNPTTQVYSTKSGAFTTNNVTAFLNWLSDRNIGGASLSGYALPISNMTANGSGTTIVQVPTTGNIKTGQVFNVSGQTGQAAATGNWAITVTNATTLTLQGSTFSAADPWVSGGNVAGATIIDTAANLAAVINSTAARTYIKSAISLGSYTTDQT